MSTDITTIPLNLPNDETIYADNHTLFIERVPETQVPVYNENGEILEGYYKTEPGFTIYKLFIGEFLEAGNGVQRIISKLQEADPDDMLEFHISIRGGGS